MVSPTMSHAMVVMMMMVMHPANDPNDVIPVSQRSEWNWIEGTPYDNFMFGNKINIVVWMHHISCYLRF